MTRDEAIDKAVLVNPSRTEALKFVDMAVALGLLKLDDTTEKSAIRSAFPEHKF